MPIRTRRAKSLDLLASERGASMVQFAIAFPIFMVFVVVIIDLGRITALGNVIREGLALGLKQATSVPNLDVDPRGIPSTDFGYQRSKIARGIVQQASMRLIGGINQIATGDDASQAAATGPKLYDIVFTEDRISDGPDAQTYKVAVLMPGECVTVPSIGVTECNRETLGMSAADPFPQQPPKFLIEKHPVKVVAFAEFDSYTPWFFKGWRKFEQFGYRSPIPPAPFPTSIDPQPYDELQAEVEADDEPLLGAAPLPEEAPAPLPVDWIQCIGRGAATGVPACPCDFADIADPTVAACDSRCCRPN